MIFINEMVDMKIYNKPFFAPINTSDKKKNSLTYLLSPNLESSKKMMTMPNMINRLYYQSYYLERDMMYVINHEGHIDLDATDGLINEYNDILDNINEATLANPFIGNYSNNLKEKNKVRKRKMRKIMKKIMKLKTIMIMVMIITNKLKTKTIMKIIIINKNRGTIRLTIRHKQKISPYDYSTAIIRTDLDNYKAI